MNGLTLKHLRYFAALAQHQHFAKAAEDCAITQPALSLQIKQLEELTGAALVDRSGRSVQLTVLGELLAARAREVLRSVDDIGDLVRSAQDELSGPFRLGVIPTIGPYLLPEVVTQISNRFPELEIILRETVTSRLVEDLRAGDIDAAIVALPISEPSLTEVPLFDETFVLVRPNADANQPVPDVASLQKMKLLLLEEGHCFRDQALSFCDIGKRGARNVMDGSSLTTLVQMVGSGIAVTLIPEMAARIEARSAAVSYTRFPDPEPSRTIGLVWRKSNPLEKQLLLLSDAVRDAGLAMREGSKIA